MAINASIQRKLVSMSDEMTKLRQQHKDNASAQSDQVANKLDMLKNKKQQILDAERKRSSATSQGANKDSATASRSEQVDVTIAIDAMLSEKAAVGGFNYEKEVNDRLKKMGKAHKDSTTAGSSADAPDAKFTHDGEEHHLEVKQNSKAMFGQIELHHDGKKWDISERSKKKYPATHAAIAATGFLSKINKQWDKPTGDYDTDLQKGNVYHTHHDAEPIKSHYGTDRKTNYIQIGGGHGFYHTGNDAAGLGSPELEGKATLRARMKYRGTDRKTGKKKYGALIVMGLKDAEKSHHNLDESLQRKWILDALQGHELFESALNPKDPHKDYEAKRKALHDLSLNKDVDQKVVQQRRLDLDKEYTKHTVKESRGTADKHWDIAQDHKEKASLSTKGTEKHHAHMADYHDSMHRYHSEIGQSSHASAHADKAEIHHEKAYEASQSVKEAHKIGDKVEIIKGSDKGTVGHVGEIRHGAFKGAPKTYTVYHGEKNAIQVKKEHIRAIKESDASWAAAKEKEKEDRVTPKDKKTLDSIRNMLAKEKKPVKESIEINELSTDTLAAYKTKAATSAREADSSGNYAKGDKRFKGINKATVKQFDNDLKKHGQYKKEHIEALKEDMLQLRKMLDKHTEKALAANKQGDDEKVKHHQRMMNKVKDQMSKLVKEDLNEEAIPFVDAFWSGQQEEPKQNPYAEDTAEYAEFENGYMQGVMTRRRIQTESRGHKTLERFFKNRNAWSATGKEGTHRETGEKTKEYQEVDHEGKPTGKRHWKNAKGQNMGEETIHEEGEGAVPANNAGDGKIAGFAGDAGKKVKMMSQPLKRKPLPKFKMYVSQEHDYE
jgi:hypothetical protein